MTTANAKFMADITKFCDAAGIKTEDSVRKIALDMYLQVKKMSPVDTGMFRANWQIGINEYPDGSFAIRKLSAREERNETKKLEKFKIGETIWIANNLPYARRLEYGWSNQAPSGMVRITVAEAEYKANMMARMV